MTNKALKASLKPPPAPQKEESHAASNSFKGLTAPHFCKSSRVFDSRFGVKKRVLSSNKGPAGSQRRARWVATAAPLQSNSSPVAEQGGPRGASPRSSPRGGRATAVHKHLCDSGLQKSLLQRRKISAKMFFTRFEYLRARRKNFGKWVRILALNSEKTLRISRNGRRPTADNPPGSTRHPTVTILTQRKI